MAIKYIMLKDKGIIIFSPLLMHNEVASLFKQTPVSAGFISFTGAKEINCYGESISLKIKSNPEIDNDLAFRQLFEY